MSLQEFLFSKSPTPLPRELNGRPLISYFFIFQVGLHILKAGVHVHVKATLTSLNTGVWKIPKSGIQNPAPEPELEPEPEPEPEK